MKKLSLIAALLMVVGCSETLESVTKTVVRDTMNQTLGTTNTTDTPASTADNGSYNQSNSGSQGVGTLEKEDIFYQQKQRTSRPYGQVKLVSTEENAAGHTRIVFRNCSHPRIGNKVSCTLGMREINAKNFLMQELISFHKLGDWKSVAAGRYYAIADYSGSGKYHASGEVNIQVGLTNYLDIVLE